MLQVPSAEGRLIPPPVCHSAEVFFVVSLCPDVLVLLLQYLRIFACLCHPIDEIVSLKGKGSDNSSVSEACLNKTLRNCLKAQPYFVRMWGMID